MNAVIIFFFFLLNISTAPGNLIYLHLVIMMIVQNDLISDFRKIWAHSVTNSSFVNCPRRFCFPSFYQCFLSRQIIARNDTIRSSSIRIVEGGPPEINSVAGF